MGQRQSCTSRGGVLVSAAGNGDTQVARAILSKYPDTAYYHTFVDRSSAMLQAAARGNHEIVQLLLEAAVVSQGPEKAKRSCLDHVNSKGHTALMLACMNGHSECVEYMLANGADPVGVDYIRHNTCLHFAALYSRSECVQKLLGSQVTYEVGAGVSFPIAQIPVQDEDGQSLVKLVDKHNGWGLTALHIAVVKGSVSTVRTLLRNSASLSCKTAAPGLVGSPVLCPPGSNAMHLAAQSSNLNVVRLLLEAQELEGGPDLRAQVNEEGKKPLDYVRATRNSLIARLMDEFVPYSAMRTVWFSTPAERNTPGRHQILGMLLQRLKLMLTLECFALRQQCSGVAGTAECSLDAKGKAKVAGGTAAQDGALEAKSALDAEGWDQAALAACGSEDEAAHAPAAVGSGKGRAAVTPAAGFATAKLAELESLLESTTQVMDTLAATYGEQVLMGNAVEFGPNDATFLSTATSRSTPRGTPAHSTPAQAAASTAADMVLSSLITPRTVAAILHAARHLVCSLSLSGAEAARSEATAANSAHALALLRAALRAIQTCLQAGRAATGGAVPASSLPVDSRALMQVFEIPHPSRSNSSPFVASSGSAQPPESSSAVDVLPPELYALHSGPSYPDLSQYRSRDPTGRRRRNRASRSANHLRSSLHTHPRRRASGGSTASRLPTNLPSDDALPHSSMLQDFVSQVCRSIQLRRTPRGSSVPAPWPSLVSAGSWQPPEPPQGGMPPLREHSPSNASLASTVHSGAPGGSRYGRGSRVMDRYLMEDEAPLSTTGTHGSDFPRAASPSNLSIAASMVATTISSDPPLRSLSTSSAASAPLQAQFNLSSYPLPLASNLASPPGEPPSVSGAPASNCPPTTSAASRMPSQTRTEPSRPGTSGGGGRDRLAGGREVSMGGSVYVDAEEGDDGGWGVAEIAGQELGPWHEGCVTESGGEDEMPLTDDEDAGLCPICMDRPSTISVTGCTHGMCLQCAFQLCSKGRNAPLCPFCRQPIKNFE